LKYWVLGTLAKKILMPKKQNIISNKQVSVNDLLELIGISTIETLAKTLGSDKWVPKLKTTTVFKLILYSILETNQLSLRTMEENYCSPIFKPIEESLVDERTAHSSICDRLINIDVRCFTQLYDKVYGLLSEQYAEKQLRDYNIKRYDSTMVAVFSHLLTGMKVGNSSKNKRQVKFSTTLENDIQIQMSFFKDQAY